MGVVVEQKQSASYGVDSKYIRRIYNAKVGLVCDFDEIGPLESGPLETPQASSGRRRSVLSNRSRVSLARFVRPRRGSFTSTTSTDTACCFKAFALMMPNQATGATI